MNLLRLWESESRGDKSEEALSEGQDASHCEVVEKGGMKQDAMRAFEPKPLVLLGKRIRCTTQRRGRPPHFHLA